MYGNEIVFSVARKLNPKQCSNFSNPNYNPQKGLYKYLPSKITNYILCSCVNPRLALLENCLRGSTKKTGFSGNKLLIYVKRLVFLKLKASDKLVGSQIKK